MRFLPLTVLIACLLCAAFSGKMAYAQPATPQEITAQTDAGAETPKDALGRETPRGTLKGFLRAIAADHYDEAARFLDLSALPRADRLKGPEIARKFKILLDNEGWLLPDTKISDKADGDTEDDLDENVDNIGTLKGKEHNIEITLIRSTPVTGPPVWLFAPALIAQIPQLAGNLDRPLIDKALDKVLPGNLLNVKFHGAPLAHWLAMAVFYLFVYLVSGVLVRGAIRICRRIPWIRHSEAPSEYRLIHAFQTPLRLLAMIWISALLSLLAGISVIVRQGFAPFSIALGWVAVGLFLWRGVNLATAYLEGRMKARDRHNMSSIIIFSRRTAKFLFAILIVILILDSFGVDVTAALAALGIGGIALALGAQKTLENFIGSLSIIIDRPIHIGDGCKIGDTVGVVEDIGMRSTRIRTNDKTLVTIPNGDLSVQRIENFSRRNSFLINRQMILRYDTRAETIRDFIHRATAILEAHDKIENTANMVRLLGFVETGYAVQIWCNVMTGDGNEYLQTQAEITYSIIDAAREAGVHFAVPSQILPEG